MQEMSIPKTGRSRQSARQAGPKFERTIADYLSAHFDGPGERTIDRQVKMGSKDLGDIRGVKTLSGGRVVVECKEYGGKFQVGPWLTEAEVERGNADAVAGVVIAKRRGVADPAEQVVFMTVRDLVALIGLERPDLHGVEHAAEVIQLPVGLDAFGGDVA